MTITLSSGDRQRKMGTFQFLATYNQSTSTTPQALDIAADIHELGMGTATGAAVRNLYTLADGIEGQEVVIFANATGEASVIMTQPTGRLPFDVSLVVNGGAATSVDAAQASATGQYVLQAAGEYWKGRFFNGSWHVSVVKGATQATTT